MRSKGASREEPECKLMSKDGKEEGAEEEKKVDHYLKSFGCQDNWCWSSKYKSKEVRIYGLDRKTVCFHPHWSNGTAAVQGTKALNRGHSEKYYWEIQVSDRIFGTSMMFGIGTRKCRLHVDTFRNLIGEDMEGWGLSHKGYLWHNGEWTPFCKPFRENESTRIGLLFDSGQGSLTYFKDGTCLGTAFTGLDKIEDDLYPMVSSTAAKTELSISAMRRDFCNLQERCRQVLVTSIPDVNALSKLPLPYKIREYIQSEMDVEKDYEEMDMEQAWDKSGDEFCITNYNSLANICGITRSFSPNFTTVQKPNPLPFLEL